VERLPGLAGASLVLAQVGPFTEQMTAGRGFVAIAIVVLGRWNPVGIAITALLFGVANASQFMFQAMDVRIPPVFPDVALPSDNPGSGRRRGPRHSPTRAGPLVLKAM